jgi:hypothetical protein
MGWLAPGTVETSRSFLGNAYTRLETPEAVAVARDADGATNISSPSYERTLHRQKCSFATRGATRSKVRIARMGRQSPQRILRFAPL